VATTLLRKPQHNGQDWLRHQIGRAKIGTKKVDDNMSHGALGVQPPIRIPRCLLREKIVTKFQTPKQTILRMRWLTLTMLSQLFYLVA